MAHFFKKNITMNFRQSGHLLDTESFDFSLNAAQVGIIGEATFSCNSIVLYLYSGT